METIKEFSSIVAFEKVATFNSYSKAATELGVSKSYLSKLVQELENELGQRLFHRSTRTVKLTSIGQVYFEKCATSIGEIKKAKQEVLNLHQQPKGHIRISLAGAFGEDYIAPFVIDFMKKYPDVSVELSFSSTVVDVIKEGIDIAIRVGNLQSSNLTVKKIAKRKLYICASPVYIHKHGQPSSVNGLKKHHCLIGANEKWKFQRNESFSSFKPEGNFKTNNGRTMLAAALNGLGVCQLPGVYVSRYIKSGQLIELLEPYAIKDTSISAVTPSKKNRSAAVNTFLAELQGQFSEDY